MSISNEEEVALRHQLASMGNSAPAFVGLPAAGHAGHTSSRRRAASVSLAAVAVLAVAVGAAVLTVDEAPGPPATSGGFAEPGGDTPSATTPSQQPGTVTLDDLRAIADRLALTDLPGYGRATIDASTGTVTVYWKGSPPPEIASPVGTQRNGVKVDLVSTEYSQSDVDRAGRAILGAADRLNAVVFQVAPNADFSGLVVGVSADSITDELTRELSQVAAMPVELVEGEPGIEQPLS